jgi:uncharacterized SAM-binding protein YcdF (DUF218 family)
MTLHEKSAYPVIERGVLRASVYLIMGAAVWPGGRASNAMIRRVEGALESAAGSLDALFLVSGGIGKHPPSEAEVMASLLRKSGVQNSRIFLEDTSDDTLSSIRNSAQILRSLPLVGAVTVCTDIYHIPRCRWLLRLYGFASQPGHMASGRSHNSFWRWIWYYAREVAAIPWDTVVAMCGKWFHVD